MLRSYIPFLLVFGWILCPFSPAAEKYESVFSREFCARFIREETVAKRALLRSEPKLAHYRDTEVTTLALRMARRNLIWAQTEAINDDLTFFKNLVSETRQLFKAAYQSHPELSEEQRVRIAKRACDRYLQQLATLESATILKGYFALAEEFNSDRLKLVISTIEAQMRVLNYMGRFFDAYTSVGDHSENYGARPIINREQISIAHAFAVSSDETFELRKYLALVYETPRSRLVPTLSLSSSDYEALDRLRKLSQNADLAPPIGHFILEYQSFMEGLNLPPTADIYPLVENLASW